MRFLSNPLSLRLFFVSLVSISALTSTFAAPVKWEDTALERRNDHPVNVDGHSITKGPQLSPPSHAKSTVWQVAKTDHHENPGHVIKTYHNTQVKGPEVAGLKAAGQYVAHDDHHVVMRHVEGHTLSHLVGGVKDHTERKEYIEKMKPKVAAKAAEYAKNHGILHDDLNMNNVIVNHHGQVDLVDWEHHVTPGHPRFTTDEKKIIPKLFWESSQTPPDYKKTSSGGRK